MSEIETYRWRGKIVSKAVYEARMRTKEMRKNKSERKSVKQRKQDKKKQEKQVNKVDYDEDKERIVSLKVLGNQLWCPQCKDALSLQFIELERRQGFGSTLIVKCHKCMLLSEVVTGKQRITSDKKQETRFERNFTAIHGAMNSGIGWSHLNKLCSFMKIPCPSQKTFKKYEKEIELAAENVATTSCSVAEVEQNLTVQNEETIEKSL